VNPFPGFCILVLPFVPEISVLLVCGPVTVESGDLFLVLQNVDECLWSAYMVQDTDAITIMDRIAASWNYFLPVGTMYIPRPLTILPTL
jgi:hypothetical protein